MIDIILHFDKYLYTMLQQLGAWSYVLLFVIIFAETGFVITPFLPGDSLLFVVGTLAASSYLNITLLFVILVVAAVAGDSINYAIGKYFGNHILLKFEGRFIKREHIEKTHRFYEKYGGKTIILARFVPIVRTFAPFVAGIGSMTYSHFFIYNVVGGILWVSVFVLGGYFFGNIPLVQKNFSIVVFVIVILSILPAVIEVIRHRKGKS
ncbi:MAG: DedA family protein [Candidatus Omnitrophota bacterium]|jgi:membrane-associated protein